MEDETFFRFSYSPWFIKINRKINHFLFIYLFIAKKNHVRLSLYHNCLPCLLIFRPSRRIFLKNYIFKAMKSAHSLSLSITNLNVVLRLCLNSLCKPCRSLFFKLLTPGKVLVTLDMLRVISSNPNVNLIQKPALQLRNGPATAFRKQKPD